MRREPFDSLHWTTNNHLTHKRTHKPKRGWFDDGHVNVVARMAVSLHHADKDSICGTLEECDAMRRQKGGKLPIGEVDALVYETKYKGIKMTKEWLKEQGKGIEFYNGVETWFDRINAYGKEHGVNVEHYLISSGNKEIVEGCKIAKQFKVIYGCEYIFDPVTGVPVWPKLAINYTQKTQYFFRISKGAVDATDDKGVNEKAKEKRIPYSNIIYIGDGMTDIPSMIIVKDNGGKSIAVYPKGKEDRVKDLYDDGRVNYVCPANYKEGSEIEKVMKLIIQGVAINESLKTRENQNVMQD